MYLSKNEIEKRMRKFEVAQVLRDKHVFITEVELLLNDLDINKEKVFKQLVPLFEYHSKMPAKRFFLHILENSHIKQSSDIIERDMAIFTFGVAFGVLMVMLFSLLG